MRPAGWVAGGLEHSVCGRGDAACSVGRRGVGTQYVREGECGLLGGSELRLRMKCEEIV